MSYMHGSIAQVYLTVMLSPLGIALQSSKGHIAPSSYCFRLHCSRLSLCVVVYYKCQCVTVFHSLSLSLSLPLQFDVPGLGLSTQDYHPYVFFKVNLNVLER